MTTLAAAPTPMPRILSDQKLLHAKYPEQFGCNDEKDAAFLLTVQSFLLTVELVYLQLTILVFTYSWSFFLTA